MPNKDIPIGFPVKGMDVTREFGQQPDQTCADAVNVASRDSIAGRDRGGSRTGFSKYIPAQGADGAVKVQMLDIIVDPSLAALTQAFETPTDDWVPHPRLPGIFIPPHGAPWQPNPGPQPAKKKGGGTLSFSVDLSGGGESGGGATNTQWDASVTYKPAFSDLEVSPGTSIPSGLCDEFPAREQGVTMDGNPIGYVDVADSDAFHAWLVEFGYVGGGTSTSDVIATFSLLDGGPC